MGRTDDQEDRRNLEILEFFIGKKYNDKVFHAENTIFESFVQDLLSISINLLLTLYLV